MTTVLWVIFWIFAVLLALVLLVVVILLLPIRYRVNAANNGDEMLAARASWLFKIVRFNYEFIDGKEKWSLYVLFFKIYPKKRKKKRKKIAAPKRVDESHSATQSEPEKKSAPPPAPKEKKPPEEKKSLSDRIIEILTVLTDERGKIIIKQVVALLRKEWKILRPKYFDVSGTVGLGCPFNTAMVLGLYESVAGMLDIRRNVRFAGDFNADDTFLHYKAELRGNICMLRAAIPVIRFAMREPVKSWLIKLWSE